MPPQDRPLIRVGNRWVPGPPVVQNPNLRSLLTPEAGLIVGPETSQVNVSSLQPPAPETPTPTIVDLVSKLFSDAKDWVAEQGVSGIARTVARAVPAVVDYERGKPGRMVDAARRVGGAAVDAVRGFNLNESMRDVAQGASDIPGEQWASAAQTFGEGLGLPHVPLTNSDGQPLSQNPYLQGAAMVGAMAVPFPGGKIAKVADKVGDAAKALRGPAATKFDVLRKTIGEERFDQLLYDWNEAYVDPDTGRLMTTLSDRFSESGRQQHVPIAKQHFLDWVAGKDGATGASEEAYQMYGRGDYGKDVLQTRDELRRVLLGEPSPAVVPAPRGAEVAAAPVVAKGFKTLPEGTLVLRPLGQRTSGSIRVRPDQQLTVQPLEGVIEGVQPINLERAQPSLSRRQVQLSEARDQYRPKNPAMVLPATDKSPALAVGDLQPEDWIAYRMSLLTDDEVVKARKWYAKLKGGFDSNVGPKETPKLLPAWAASQQQASPQDGFLNVMRVEQQERGVPSIWWRKPPPEVEKAATALRLTFKVQAPKTWKDPEKIAAFVNKQRDERYKAVRGALPEHIRVQFPEVRPTDADVLRVEPSLGQMTPGLAAEKIRSILRGETPETGIGKKLSDFYDNTFDKPVRTYMGNDPRGGYPTAIDVWAGRDRGFIDQDVYKRIEDLYGRDVAKQFKVDYTGTIDDNRYEEGVQFYQEVTDLLNKENRLGGGWTPREAQAVGWTAFQRAFGRRAQDSVDIFEGNTRTAAFELSFGTGSPYAQKFAAFDGLSYDAKADITEEVAKKTIDLIAQDTGVRVQNMFIGPGGYEAYPVQPSGQVQLLAPPERVQDFIDSLGYLFNQTEVLAARPNFTPKKADTAIQVTFDATPEVAKDVLPAFWAQLQKSMPSAFASQGAGFSPAVVDGKLAIRLFRPANAKTWSDKDALQRAIKSAATSVADVPQVTGVKGFIADVLSAKNDWRTRHGGEAFLDSLGSRGRSDLQGRLVGEYSQQVESWIGDALRRYAEAPQPLDTGAAEALSVGANGLVAPSKPKQALTALTPSGFAPSGGVQ